jgi:hypothetical protein
MPPISKTAIRTLDPVFIIMLVAIVLAVATSFTLRLAAGGLGPARARAEEFNPSPAFRHHAAPPLPPSQ